METTVGDKFILIKKIGAGSFGEVYSGTDKLGKVNVAIKLESVKVKSPQLLYESKLYRIFAGCISIPRLYSYGTQGSHNIIIIDLLGKSLEDLAAQANHRLSLKTVLMCSDQMISALEFIHNRGFIHRDVKPDNFMIGRDNHSNQIYIIDFGLSKQYCDSKTKVHIPMKTGKPLIGTARYASINTLKGNEQSRRDDLESLGYVFLYLLLGHLPWMGLPVDEHNQRYERILQVKSVTSIDELCSSNGIPLEFAQFLNLVRNLGFEERPNYSAYRELFRNLFIRLGYQYDYKYDWVEPREIPNKISGPASHRDSERGNNMSTKVLNGSNFAETAENGSKHQSTVHDSLKRSASNFSKPEHDLPVVSSTPRRVSNASPTNSVARKRPPIVRVRRGTDYDHPPSSLLPIPKP